MRTIPMALAAALVAALAACAPRRPEFPQPTKHHRQLSAWEGAWSVQLRQPGPPLFQGAAAQTDRFDIGGLWLISELQGDLEGQPFRAHAVIGYDTQKSKYTGFWIDSRSTAPICFEGDLSSDARSLVLVSTTKTVRLVTEWKDRNTRTLSILSIDRSGKETPTLEAVYSRKP
jgi:hypothetical protein